MPELSKGLINKKIEKNSVLKAYKKKNAIFLFSFSLSFEETNFCINLEKKKGKLISPGIIHKV